MSSKRNLMMAIGIITLAALSRLVPHIPNFAPITATALFAGIYLPRKYAFIIPVCAMLLSDLLIGFDWSSLGYVYGSFIAIGVIGHWVRAHRAMSSLLIATVGSSLLFFLVTNFGVWANPNSWYPRTLAGLIECLVAGIPFYRNTLLGDVTYTLGMVGAYELIQRKIFLSSSIRGVPDKSV
ncbi:hypothetical protein A2631_02380 [Candidatus Daviesbacteria bacterium RIFCSPHIGHO2_01_FULL_44_29]|uniref:Rod shape-determining protein MreD n=1 Tax=Candidatus Daviesbacteria bacterium RIFCSPHIGHO2_02_FULL_43_12 TaxID=1797776 RepID=A0A1F5KJZ5_9BACT|nr:MAG: hypothetical protein A2631_02380 [Candidatus Daviesbacteria bacterium RIFCSPHIGHO2_01_FULL_44_29]OGE41238.1 MAG: hypothetical protein A3D25_01775 [Candidatus Daviesbacteria bacterium RIFCSPHIGHO2_02_FULL_43_12]OGE69439.1 MAG: hypothetical protein A3B55_03515 [Candidatus Daviesbacteria bacterium RIFCSPLOWO2_01_FULL_43_15]